MHVFRNASIVTADGVADPITVQFGAIGGIPGPLTNVSTGILVKIAELDNLWERLTDVPSVRSLRSYPGTQGSAELLEAIGMLEEHESFRLHPDASHVATHGALDGIAHALATLPPGSRVMYPHPGWAFEVPIRRAGMNPTPVTWRMDESVADWLRRVELTDFEHAQDESRALIVNFPHNPSGQAATDEDWATVSGLLDDPRFTLIVDNVYGFLDTNQPKLPSTDRVIVVDSLSKRLGAPGLRLGWVSCHPDRLNTIRASSARTSVGVSSPSADLGTAGIAEYVATDVRGAITKSLESRSSALRLSADAAGIGHRLRGVEGGLYANFQLVRMDASPYLASAVRHGYSFSAFTDGTHAYLRACIGSTDDMAGLAAVVRSVITEIEGPEESDQCA